MTQSDFEDLRAQLKEKLLEKMALTAHAIIMSGFRNLETSEKRATEVKEFIQLVHEIMNDDDFFTLLLQKYEEQAGDYYADGDDTDMSNL
jgi:hypothetical protein